MKNSHFVTKLVDIIVPGDHFDLHKKNDSFWTIDHVFIVMDFIKQDLN